MRGFLGIVGWLVAAVGVVALAVSGLCGIAGLFNNAAVFGMSVVFALVSLGVFVGGRGLYRWGFGADTQRRRPGWRIWLGWGLMGLGVLEVLQSAVMVLTLDTRVLGVGSGRSLVATVAPSVLIGFGLLVVGYFLRRSGLGVAIPAVRST